MTDNTMRREFEAWATTPQEVNGKPYAELYDISIDWDGVANRYANILTRCAFEGYTAAASSRDELVKRLVGALEYYARHDSFTDYADKAITEAKAQGYGE